MSRFVQAARQGENHWAYYGFTIVLILLAFVVGPIPIGLLIDYKNQDGSLSHTLQEEISSTLDFTMLGIPSYASLLLILLGHILAMAVICLAIVYVHKRPLKTVVSSRTRIDYRRIFFAFALWMALSGIAELVMFAMFPADYSFHFNVENWLPLLLVAVFVLPIQTSFEEVFFRGYLLQGMAFITRSKWVVIILTSVLFAVMHLGNPEVREFGLGIMGLYYISVALFLVIITFLDEGLELALGIHAATNIYGATIVSFDGSVLQTDALFRINNLNPVWMVALFFGMMVVFVIIANRKYQLQRFSTLFRPIDYSQEREKSIEL